MDYSFRVSRVMNVVNGSLVVMKGVRLNEIYRLTGSPFIGIVETMYGQMLGKEHGDTSDMVILRKFIKRN